MSQCTHVIVFSSTDSKDLPSEVSAYPQVRIVNESWLNACIKSHSLLDTTPYLIRSASCEPGSIFLVSLI